MSKRKKFQMKQAALVFKRLRFDMDLHADAEQKVIDLMKISSHEAKVRALYGTSHTGKTSFLKSFIKKYAEPINSFCGIQDIVLIAYSAPK